MRPGHFCPGNVDDQFIRWRTFDGASMRPGHFCPGNGERKLRPLHPGGASMRPGHFCPGNEAALARRAAAYKMLQ